MFVLLSPTKTMLQRLIVSAQKIIWLEIKNSKIPIALFIINVYKTFEIEWLSI